MFLRRNLSSRQETLRIVYWVSTIACLLPLLVLLAAFYIDSVSLRLFGYCFATFGVGYALYGWPGTWFPVAVNDMIDYRKLLLSNRMFFDIGPAFIWLGSFITLLIGVLSTLIGAFFAAGFEV